MGTMKKAKLLRARYLLPSAGAPAIEDGALLIVGGRIAAVGSYSTLQDSAAEVIDYGDAVILPPLVNAHCHLELTDFPQWTTACGETTLPTSFVGWIRRLIRVRRSIGADPVPASVSTGIRQLLAAGTGAVGDILTTPGALAPLLASPLYGRIFFETIGLDEERFIPALAAALASARSLTYPLSGGLSPHSTYTVSARHLEKAISTGLPLAIHCAESPEESLFLREGRGPIAAELYAAAGWPLPEPAPGLSPVAWLAAQGALSAQTLLVHGVQVNAEDAVRIAGSGAIVVLCPRSNARLGVGTAPIGLYKKAGVSLALGTDSRASNDSLSLWEEIAFARSVYPELSPEELLAIATCGGARALGLEQEMGVLTVGSGAHLQVLTAANLPPVAGLAGWLCGAEHQVVALWLGGIERLR
ncbi:MAG: metal-dependent hydrolase [Deltaproteobacteria bacterium HGW-Deltaproteobacteria-4]|nr:MAG: metal-dependent hydrolase [Deltaproteobacteria bacterium HGW-Deltaproteobacteria-4]